MTKRSGEKTVCFRNAGLVVGKKVEFDSGVNGQCKQDINPRKSAQRSTCTSYDLRKTRSEDIHRIYPYRKRLKPRKEKIEYWE